MVGTLLANAMNSLGRPPAFTANFRSGIDRSTLASSHHATPAFSYRVIPERDPSEITPYTPASEGLKCRACYVPKRELRNVSSWPKAGT
jgi:hypothetical protein